MKSKFLLIVFLLNSVAVFAQKIYEKPVVDERVEVMYIVFRLAGAEEYQDCAIPLYANEIDKHFEKYKNHSLIQYTKKLRSKYWMSFNSVANLAIHLEIKNGKLIFNKNININLDDRWQKDSIPKYMVLLNDFYKKSKFNDFFVKTENIRKFAEENFAKEVTDKIDFDWFKKFFGFLPEHKFRIIISLADAGHNYGPKIVYKDETEEYYAIMCSSQVDGTGFPIYDGILGSVENISIHEICHSFCRVPINEYLDKLLPQATVFYQLYQKELYEYARCGKPESLLHEIFVRACVFQYNKDHKKYDEDEMKSEIYQGFLWLPQLTEAFGRYKNDTIYKTFRDFMPEIVKLQNSLNPQQLYDEIAEITGTNIPNNCDTVDYNLDYITVRFNNPMLIYPNVTRYLDIRPKLEFTKEEKWNDNGTEWTCYIKLKPDTQYKIWLPYFLFFDAKNQYYLRNDHYLNFKTKSKQ